MSNNEPVEYVEHQTCLLCREEPAPVGQCCEKCADAAFPEPVKMRYSNESDGPITITEPVTEASISAWADRAFGFTSLPPPGTPPTVVSPDEWDKACAEAMQQLEEGQLATLPQGFKISLHLDWPRRDEVCEIAVTVPPDEVATTGAVRRAFDDLLRQLHAARESIEEEMFGAADEWCRERRGDA